MKLYPGIDGGGAHTRAVLVDARGMVLEDESTGETRLVPLAGRSVVCVPGHTEHRAANTGHHHDTIATKNFSRVFVATPGKPQLSHR